MHISEIVPPPPTTERHVTASRPSVEQQPITRNDSLSLSSHQVETHAPPLRLYGGADSDSANVNATLRAHLRNGNWQEAGNLLRNTHRHDIDPALTTSYIQGVANNLDHHHPYEQVRIHQNLCELASTKLINEGSDGGTNRNSMLVQLAFRYPPENNGEAGFLCVVDHLANQDDVTVHIAGGLQLLRNSFDKATYAITQRCEDALRTARNRVNPLLTARELARIENREYHSSSSESD